MRICRLVRPCWILILAVVVLAPAPVEARSARAFGEAADAGQIGAVIAFEQLMETPLAVNPAPAFRPTFRADVVGGLPGPLDLVATGHAGGRLFSLTPIWGASAGLRLAPFDADQGVRPSVWLTGGARTVPGDNTLEVAFSDDVPSVIREDLHPAVGLSRIALLLELHRNKERPQLLLRFAYEAHWAVVVSTSHAETTTQRWTPVLASNLFEARIGMLTSPEKEASPFFEVGLFGYLPVQPEEMSAHAGLIVELGIALGSSGGGERFTPSQ